MDAAARPGMGAEPAGDIDDLIFSELEYEVSRR